MTMRRSIVISIAGLIAASVIGYLCLPKEPRYQGRALSEWIEESRRAYLMWARGDPKRRLSDYSEWQIATNAVQQIGTNAIPQLLRWASAHDSKTRQKLIIWLRMHPSFHFRIRSAEERQLAAYFGFSLLGRTAEPAWPGLVQLTHEREPDSRRCGMDCLIITKADSATLRPVLRDLVKDPDEKVRRTAAGELHYFFPGDAAALGIYKDYPYIEGRPTVETYMFPASPFP